MACERIRELCDKLYHPRNSLCRSLMPKWYEDSSEWARYWKTYEDYDIGIIRMNYILNHMCSDLVHLLPKPKYSYVDSVLFDQKYMSWKFENTQMSVTDCDGVVISKGIQKTQEEWKFLLCAISPLVCKSMNVDVDAYLVMEGFSVPLSGSLKSVVEEYQTKYEELEI